MKYLVQIFAICVLFFSCKKDVPPVKSTYTGNISSNKRVFVSNEGGFGYNNATINLYDPLSGNVVADIYKPNNNNQNLGDICQSLCFFNNSIYAIVNNSNKIVVIDKNTFVKSAVISGFNSPRYMLPVSNNKAYVTDLYANAISIVDLNSNTKTGSIPCSGWTEEMVISFGKVFVTNIRRDKLYVINTSNDQIIDSIPIAYGAGSVVKDKNEKLWVACSGDSLKGSLPRIVRIDPITHEVEQSFIFNYYASSPSQLKINGTGDKLYYLNNDLYTLDITASQLNSNALITRGNKLFYALGIDPLSEDIYISDAIDYVQNGKVMIYSKQGTHLKTFDAGIIPGGIYFLY